MAEIGATPGGGMHRLTLSDDRRARDLLVAWLAGLDSTVTVDEMGDIFGPRGGRDESLPPVITGSHLDTQPRGGRFDDVLGVMGALEVLRTLRDHDVGTLRPVELVDWTNEEGSRFAPAMLASGVWAGALDRDWAWARTDADGFRRGERAAPVRPRRGGRARGRRQRWPREPAAGRHRNGRDTRCAATAALRPASRRAHSR